MNNFFGTHNKNVQSYRRDNLIRHYTVASFFLFTKEEKNIFFLFLVQLLVYMKWD
jgi:hypothetical protein